MKHRRSGQPRGNDASAGLIEDEVLHELKRDLDVEEMGVILQRGE